MVCASSAPPVAGPATTSVFSCEVARDHVEQILRQPPDRRRMPEQLVRVQVDAAVEAVAVVEMPVGHQDPERLHVLAGALARDEMAVGHVLGGRLRAVESAGAGVAAGIGNRSGDGHGGEGADAGHVRVGVDDAAADDGGGDAALQRPAAERRVLRLRDEPRRIDGDAEVGRQDRRRRRRAPGVSAPPATPRIRAGFTDSSSTKRVSVIRPGCTRRSNVSGTHVSRPTMPNGARSNSTRFSSAWCGA